MNAPLRYSTIPESILHLPGEGDEIDIGSIGRYPAHRRALKRARLKAATADIEALKGPPPERDDE
jgi:hypothetical protein